MSRIPILDAESAPEESQALVKQSQANSGFLPNLIGVLAHAPVALQTYTTVGAINAQSSLSIPEREAVQLTAAHVHGCDFCLAGHGALMVKKAGLPREVVKALQTGERTGIDRLDAIADFTKAVIRSRGAVSDQEYRAFRAHRFGHRQALEIVLGVSLATLCNFANSLAATEVNSQLTPYLPSNI